MVAPAASFVRFVVGFCAFISVSFGVTYVANVYAVQKDLAEEQAAAVAEMLGEERGADVIDMLHNLVYSLF